MPETPSPTVRAQWVGPYGDRFADGTLLVPNDTVCDMPRDEAEMSDNWQVMGDEPEADAPPAGEPEPESTKSPRRGDR